MICINDIDFLFLIVAPFRRHLKASSNVCENTHMTTSTPRPIPFFHHRTIITLEGPLLKRVQQGIKVPPTIISNEKIVWVGVCACADSCLLTRFAIDRHSINIHQIHPRPGIPFATKRFLPINYIEANSCIDGDWAH